MVVNCSGLASRWLANDKDLIPLRGQILRVAALFIINVLSYKLTFFDSTLNVKI